MQFDRSIVKVDKQSPTSDCLSSLVQEAAGLQVLTHKFAMLILAANASANSAIASPPQIRQILHELMASWKKLRSTETSFLKGCDTALVQTMDRAFSSENESVISCFETMARSACAALFQDHGLSLPDSAELVRFVSDELTQTNKSIVAAAKMVDDAIRQKSVKLALTDILTGLPNRRALIDLLNEFQEGEWPHNQVTVIHIDLDNFKAINDSLGHAAGDAALQHAAHAMLTHAQQDDFLARIGGDEFILISFGDLTKDASTKCAKTLIDAIAAPFMYANKRCKIRGSAGIAFGTKSDVVSIDQCIMNADMALYDAKNSGRSTFCLFTPQMRTQSDNKEDLVTQIRLGIDTHQFEPFFQPQVEGRTGKLVGLEALARWNHPTRGTLSPFHFLGAAGDAELLEELDIFLMKRTFSLMENWHRCGIRVPQVSINLTSSRLLAVDLVENMLADVKHAELDPSFVGIEILESAMIDDNSEQMIDNIRDLGDAGFKLELDDFGTGHASISNLRNFKVDRIKIDQSFVKDVHLDPDLAKITGAMINLAHSLRVDALAEGVETPEERLVLNALGCDHIQGFGVSHPIPSTAIPDWISRTQKVKTLPNHQF